MAEPNGVPIDFGEYNFMVPGGLESAQPLFRLASKYLDLYDQATRHWRENCKPPEKTTANGVLLGLGDRSREALRASQLLAGHALFKDSVQVLRPIAEAAIYAQHICKDGVTEMQARAEDFERFQAVERKQNLERIRAMGRVGDMRPEAVEEIEREYQAVEANFKGGLFNKAPFNSSLRQLAKDSRMEFVYRTAFNHASAFSHITTLSLAPLNDRDLGLGLAVCMFPVVFRILEDALDLGVGAELKPLEEETNAVCRQLTELSGAGSTNNSPAT